MENLTPEVSVLLPVRQWRDTTQAAVSSLLSQTLQELEILVIGQNDAQDLCARLPADRRIRAVVRQGDGIVAALNTGLKHAHAPYIARMDDDDIAYPERLAVQLAYLQQNPSIGLCAARIRFVDEFGNNDSIRLGNRAYEHWLNALTTPEAIRQACLIECPMPHPTWMAHRDVWNQLDGYRDFDGPEDYDLILRALQQGIDLGKPEPVLQDWREHPDRLTYRDERYRREAFTERKVAMLVDPSSKLVSSLGHGVWLCGTGRNARHWHDSLTHHGVTVHGFVDIKASANNRRKRNKRVIDYHQLPALRGQALVITTLTQPQARAELLSYFDQLQWHSGRHFILGG